MLGWIILVLIVVLVLRPIIGLLSGFLGAKRVGEPSGQRRGKRTALVRDPVCGTYVEPSHAISARAGSTVHYFCSERCRQGFAEG